MANVVTTLLMYGFSVSILAIAFLITLLILNRRVCDLSKRVADLESDTTDDEFDPDFWKKR